MWNTIDRPADGSVFMVYLPASAATPPDGLQYMDGETVHEVRMPGRILECRECKLGFYPGAEPVTSRVRRRFRITAQHGGNDDLWLLQYLRSVEADRRTADSTRAQPRPARAYPMPPVTSRPFQLFEIAPQNGTAHSMHMAQRPQRPPQPQVPQQMQQMQDQRKRFKEDEDRVEGDELDFMIPRNVSRTRFILHHEWMQEVLESLQTVYEIKAPDLLPASLGQAEKGAMEKKLADLQDEISRLEGETEKGSIPTSQKAVVLDEALQQLNAAEDLASILKAREFVDEQLGLRTVDSAALRYVAAE